MRNVRFAMIRMQTSIISHKGMCGNGYGVPLTEDLQHGQTFGAVRVVDPFESLDRTPAECSGSVGAMNWSGEQDRRLIEDQLPLDVLNAIFAKEKLHPRHYVSLNPLLAGRADRCAFFSPSGTRARPSRRASSSQDRWMDGGDSATPFPLV